MDTQPTFRFLDLPRELRLRVCEHSNPTAITREITAYLPEPNSSLPYVAPYMGKRLMLLHYNAPPVALLSTCKLIQQEARPIITKDSVRDLPHMTVATDSHLQDGIACGGSDTY